MSPERGARWSRRGALVGVALVALVALACGRPPTPARPAPAVDAPAGDVGSWSFAVKAREGARELEVEAQLSAGSGEELSVDQGAEPYVQGVEVQRGGSWERVEPRGSSWFVPACKGGCQLRYRFRLDEAAAHIDDVERAGKLGAATMAPPSTWLLHPLRQETVGHWRLRVESGETPFLTGLYPDGAGGYEAATSDLPESPYSGFGPFRRHTLRLNGGEIELALGPGKFALDDEVVVGWVRRSAEAVAGFYEKLPVKRVALFVFDCKGRGVMNGRTLGNGGASIMVGLGESISEGELMRDWVMPHELIHTAFPSMPRHQSWIEEGLSTYVEPVARARLGQLKDEEVWGDFARSMPQGQPEPGDRGLDQTATWGRTYWGGAIFCLLADVEIRKRTHNQRSLDDALRAIIEAGGTVAHRWPLERALTTGDQATGTTVLSELHAAHARRPITVDLAGLWASLGVAVRGDAVVFDQTAPLADVRRAITARR